MNKNKKHTNLWNEVYHGKPPTNDDTFIKVALSVLIAFCFIVYAVVSLVEAYQVLN